MKVCTKCKIEKDEKDFYVKNRKTGTKCSICIECNTQICREYYKNHKEKAISRATKWREDNRERTRDIVQKSKRKNRWKYREQEKQYALSRKDRTNELNRIRNRGKKASGQMTNAERWAKENPEKYKQMLKKMRDELKPSYVRAKARRQGFNTEILDKHPEIVEAKKLILKIKRYGKSKKDSSKEHPGT